MKCLLLADNRPDLLATLEPILKHWGYRVVSATTPKQATEFLAESTPDLLIIGQEILCDQNLDLGKKATKQITESNLPLIVLKNDEQTDLPITPQESLDVPVDIFALFSFIQRYVEKHPRQNLRLPIQLPGMYRVGSEEFVLSDVMSLSTHGLFFRSAMRLKKNDEITVIFPLFGHCKELEISSRVLYVIQPEPANNYMQGFGVGFDDLSETKLESLQKYIEEHFLNEVSASQNGVGDFSQAQLKR